jgi:hypothetical protein
MSDTKHKECGSCRHWDAGQCFRFPPLMVPTAWDNQHPITYLPSQTRPEVGATARACGEWGAA